MATPSETPTWRAATAAGIAVVATVFAVLVWRHRWIADDGMIYVRTIRMILHGDGPVFNAAERAEANTSTLWPWLVAAVAAITRGDPARIAVWLGGLCSVAGLVIAMDATRRWHRARGVVGMIAPAGALCVVGIVPFWDFGTSGLESGLSMLWIAAAWAGLVGLFVDDDVAGGGSPRRLRWTALLFGLGPMVRPDLAVATAVFLAAGAWIAQPPWRRALGLAVIAGALPVAYEVFRAGYYGAIVPLPAIAKSATGSKWDRGLAYFFDFAQPYAVWFPAAVLGALSVGGILRGVVRRRAVALVAAPVISGVLIGAFVIRVGGDFMHGRMLLLPALLVVLPVAVVPWTRWTALPVVLIAGWATFRYVALDPRLVHPIGINDEHRGYVSYTGDPHPIDGDAYLAVNLSTAGVAYLADVTGQRRVLSEGGMDLPGAPDAIAPIAVFAGRLGVGGLLAPIDGFAGDTLGLANPLGARIEPTDLTGAGHEKALPMSWLVADFGRLDEATAAATGFSLAELRAAKHAMSCGALGELMASVRAPMTPSRFWQNLIHAVARTRLVVPTQPFVAERTFCTQPLDPNLALGARITASSSYQSSGWSLASVVDGERASTPSHGGYCSGLGQPASAEVWVELELPAPVAFSRVVLHPAFDAGFPIDFAVQVERDHQWVDVVRRTELPRPPQAPQTFPLAAPVTATKIRLDATRLRQGPSGYLLQLAELELLP